MCLFSNSHEIFGIPPGIPLHFYGYHDIILGHMPWRKYVDGMSDVYYVIILYV